MRAVKWAGIGLGALLLVALLLVLVLPYVVNFERYRSLLAARASRALGREVTLGALRVSLWSGLGAEAQGIRVAAAQGFGPEPFLAADALRVRVQFLPLFRGQVKVSTAVLEQPRIRLTHTADGAWSIEDLFKPTPAAPPARQTPDAPRPSKPPLLGGLLLSEVAVKNGEITVLEQAAHAPRAFTLKDVDLRMRQANLSDAIDVRLRARVGDEGGRIDTTGRIMPEAERPTLDLKLTLREVSSALLQSLLLGPDSALQLGGRLSGEAQVAGPVSKVAVTGSLDLEPLDIRMGGLAKPAGEKARLAFELHREEPGLEVSRLQITLKDLEVQGRLRIPDLKSPQLVFDASSPRLDLDRLLAAKPAKAAWLGSRAAEAAPPPPSRTPPPRIEGRVRIADLRYAGLSWAGVEGELRYEDGLLRILSAEAGFMQGRVAVSGELDFRPRRPRATLTSRLTEVATGPLLKSLGVGPWSLQSALTGQTSLTFSGFSGPAILGSASGSGSVRLKDGRLIDYKPLERLSEVIAPILAAQGLRVRLDEFQQLTGSFTVDQGILRTKDLTLTKAEGVVTAAGTLGLLDSTLNLDVSVRLGRTTVEARVTGTTNQPIVVPKLGRVQQRLGRELDKVLPGEQGKSLKDMFRGFFGK